MKRRFLTAILTALVAYPLVGVISFAGSNAGQRYQLPQGRYTCASVNSSSALQDVKLVSKDKYESGDKVGIYVYEASERRIEWLSGAISRQLVGFYLPKGVDNSSHDTIIVRDKRDVDAGNNRDLWRCNLAQ